MRIVSAFLANHVEVQNSKVFAHGAFPENWVVAEIPNAVIVGVGVVVEIEPSELGTPLTLDLVIRPVDGPELVSAHVGFQRVADDAHLANTPYYMPLAWNIPVNLTVEGPHEVALTSDDFTLDIIRFGVRLPATPL